MEFYVRSELSTVMKTFKLMSHHFLQLSASLGPGVQESVSTVDSRVFCYRRLKKKGKCGGHLKKLHYATPEVCCRGRGVGYATKKQKVGRNRFVCTPCPGKESNTLPLPRRKDKRKNKRRRKTTRSPKTTTTTTTTTTMSPVPVSHSGQHLTTTRTPVDWPQPHTESPNQQGYYAAFPRQGDEQEKIQWSEWSPCSASCGAGWRSRFKICEGCDKNDYENVMSWPCMIKLYCPVDGNWGPWFPWQPCSQSCDGGTRKRQRKCNYPPPAYGGQTCQGPATNTQACNDQLCPVEGSWGAWSDFTPCSASCGPGVKRRLRSCDSPAPAYGGRHCQGSAVLSRKCELVKCPQDGGWSLWSGWSQCSAACGQGVRTRTRACNSPRPMHGGKECEGEGVQTTHCSSSRPCPIDGGWSEWNDYGFCRAPRCDWGFRIRTRLCSDPQPQHGGAPCQGNQYERVECFNDQDCPRNGSWCPWSDWSACSSSCADETSLQVRQRACSCPEPRFGGNDCEGDSLDVRDCTGLPFCNSDVEEGAGDENGSRKCGDSGLEGSGVEEDCDQEEESKGRPKDSRARKISEK
ncbi:hypothetical protein ACOMHN_024331 [Nucella lapillus]